MDLPRPKLIGVTSKADALPKAAGCIKCWSKPVERCWPNAALAEAEAGAKERTSISIVPKE